MLIKVWCRTGAEGSRSRQSLLGCTRLFAERLRAYRNTGTPFCAGTCAFPFVVPGIRRGYAAGRRPGLKTGSGIVPAIDTRFVQEQNVRVMLSASQRIRRIRRSTVGPATARPPSGTTGCKQENHQESRPGPILPCKSIVIAALTLSFAYSKIHFGKLPVIS
jgi:hypothetical protein